MLTCESRADHSWGMFERCQVFVVTMLVELTKEELLVLSKYQVVLFLFDMEPKVKV